jgi:hypothetical protein
MATVWLECWKCEECGNRWIKAEIHPKQCSKCRSRKWNQSAGVASAELDIKSQDQTPMPTQSSAPKSASSFTLSSRLNDVPTNLAVLRSIPGIYKASDMVDGHVPPPPDVEVLRPAEIEIPICGKKWWEDGEQYECLMDAGHKSLKCGQKEMVRRIEQ